ncbi:MAG: pseudouridine-5'-phosphate glycosidase [Firmicutes bacterium]|nr:pseudouridine-5'-phosphate glycosidase [Bacillota bacterium]
MNIKINEKIIFALREQKPLVALETAVLTHGLPKPLNLETVLAMEEAVASAGAIPCTIGVLQGEIILGLSQTQLQDLAQRENVFKIGLRELPVIVVKKLSGGTTVAATAYLAHRYGLRVLATGGIGGVHRGATQTFDISADLTVLARTPLTVVASGAKAIMDLGLTLEYLETMGTTVVGYKTKTFPAFYASSSPYKLPLSLNSPQEIAATALARDELGLSAAVLICNPVPEAAQIPYEDLMELLAAVEQEVQAEHIRGQDVTPLFLKRLAEKSGGRSLEANRALLIENARLAGKIALAVAQGKNS